MTYITDIEDIKLNNSIVTIGKFDGSHLGHKLLYGSVVKSKNEINSGINKQADKEKAIAVILTFTSDIKGNISDNSIMTNFEKMDYDYPDGIDYVVECPFSSKIKFLSPEDFAKKILIDRLGALKVVVGNDFRFGYERSGDVKTLKELGCELGFDVQAVEKIKYNGREISSSYIKEEIKKGNMESVKDMLGESFCIKAKVMHGKELGRKIGFPTINFIASDDKILPPDGGYATRTYAGGRYYYSITNIGLRPTVEDSTIRTIETYIFDFDRDVYGEILRVEFDRFLRPEKKFESIDELKQEINDNIKTVKDYYGITHTLGGD